ncbi:MAG: hypothetical protein K2L80_00765 [Muribaculaceae bacterium]|nr:hypothetical protein [Muribaculaceae bacterium]
MTARVLYEIVLHKLHLDCILARERLRALGYYGQKKTYRKIISRISERGHANVVFIASSLSMWRYDGLCRMMMADSRFSVYVVIHPFNTYSIEARKDEIRRMASYFDSLGVPYIVSGEDGEDSYKDFKAKFRPDMIFYVQHYEGVYGDSLEWRTNRDCLLAYIPYTLTLAYSQWSFNQDMHNVLWRSYQPSEVHRRVAVKLASNRGRNISVAGDPRFDSLTAAPLSDPWKAMPDGRHRKRVIFAPHFQVRTNNLFNRPEFIQVAELMLQLAVDYSDRLQFAFKPHPRLKSELYDHPEWGVEKTDRYYRQWSELPNCQMEEGDYIDLFIHSDAIIHNCGSFTCEYLMTRKPAAFVAGNLAEVEKNMHEYALACMDAHYTVYTEPEIRDFVDNVVLAGVDPRKKMREKVFAEYLTPPDTGNTAMNVFNDIINSFGWN